MVYVPLPIVLLLCLMLIAAAFCIYNLRESQQQTMYLADRYKIMFEAARDDLRRALVKGRDRDVEPSDVTPEEIAYVMQSLGAPVPADAQEAVEKKAELFDQIIADLEALKGDE